MSGTGATASPDDVPIIVPRAALEQEVLAAADTATRRQRRCRMLTIGLGVVALVALCAAVAVGVLVLRKSPGAAISVPERFSATFSAQAVASDSNPSPMPYTGTLVKDVDTNGKWLFSGQISFTADGRKTVVTLVENRAFYTYTNTATGTMDSSGCLTAESLPAWQELEAAFTSASPLSANENVVDHLEGKCAQHEKFVINWGGFTYVFCSTSGNGGTEYQFVGEEFAADLFDLHTGDATVSLSVPEDAQGQAMSCPELVYPSPSSRRLRSAPRDADAATWFLQSTADAVRERRLASGKKCVFMHGLGHADNKASSGKFTDYWGDVHKWAECSSYTFIIRDTKNVAFDDPALLSHFCTEAGGPTIDNTIIFTHSMGSLIAAAALETGTCSFTSTTRWYQVEGPLAGAKAANFAASMCSNGAVGWLADLMGFCGGASINSLKTSYTTFSKYASVISNNVDGAMCGTSGWGLNTLYSAPIAAAGGIISFSESSDGIVGWSSCDFHMPGGFGDHYNNAYYKPGVNHLDGTCRNGNGWIPFWGGGEDRQPCRWFKARTQ